MNYRTYPGADCDTDHQLLVATMKVSLTKRQRQHSIPPLNLEEFKEEKAVQFAAEVTNRFTAFCLQCIQLPSPKRKFPQFSAHVCCGQMAGWVKIPLGTNVGLGPHEVAPEDLWKGIKTVLLEVARETIGSVKSQKKKKWMTDDMQ